MIYASELATRALGLVPDGSPHTGDACVCAMCQRSIKSGDLSVPKVLTRSFMDFSQLAPSDFLCGFCAVTSKQKIMRNFQRCVITEKGIYNLNTDDARAWLWLTPPEPPFVVVINHTVLAAFHFFWRTPVNLDIGLVHFNVDNVLYQVRRSRVLKALEYAKLIVDRAPVLAKKKSVLKSPFNMVARDPMKNKKAIGNNGRLAKDALALAEMFPDCKEAADFLQNLSPGELIAVSPFLKQNPSTPVQPELITTIPLE